jgi:uncharacterized membrane protein YgcG
MRRGSARRQQSGSALLIVLLIGAIIAISLYREVPRIAFESQRQREQLLIERGEQYKRAIQLFVKTNQRWPSEIKDLESFNNIRYLRKRFIDPMTGKDEWRLVHISNGVLQDSVNVKKDQTKTGPTERTDSYVGLQAGIGQTLSQPGSQGSNVALRRRASDNNPLPSNEIPIDPSVQSGQVPQPGQPPQPGQSGQPGQQPGVNIPGQQPGNLPPGVLPPGIPGTVINNGQPGQVMNGNTPFGGRTPGGVPGINQPGQQGSNPSTSQSGSSYIGGGSSYIGGGSYIGSAPAAGTSNLPPQPGAPVNSQTGNFSPTQYPTARGANGNPPNYPQPGIQPGMPSGTQPGTPSGTPPVNAVPNPATQMINTLLGSPRPGGAPNTTAPGGLIGAGIAGVASNLDSDSIMIYSDHQNYSEWEFIFDPAKQKRVVNPVTGQIGVPASTLGTSPVQTGTSPVQAGGAPVQPPSPPIVK